MIEKYVKLNDVQRFLDDSVVEGDEEVGAFIPVDIDLSKLPLIRIDSSEKFIDDNDGKVEPCPFYKTNHILLYNSNGVPEVKVVGYCQRERDKGQTSGTCHCAGRKIACMYSAQTRMEGIMTEMSPDEKERAYWIRTHMTAISRYLRNEKPEHKEEYKRLALEAAQAILRIVNGGTAGEKEKGNEQFWR